MRGLYLAVLTLGLLMLGQQLFKQWGALTGGSGVGRSVALPVLFGTDLTFTYAVGPLILTKETSIYLLCLVLLVLLGVAARNLARSRTGRAFAAVRDRDIAAELMGVSLLRTKTLAFMLSSAYAGVGGALLSILVGRIAPEQWDLFLSITMLAVVVIGGVATITGSLIGAAFVVLLPRLLGVGRALPAVRQHRHRRAALGLPAADPALRRPHHRLPHPRARGLFGLWHRVRTYFTTWPFSY